MCQLFFDRNCKRERLRCVFGQRGCGFVIDRASGRVNVMSATLTGIATTRDYFMMSGDFITGFAKDTFGVKIIFEPFKTRIIGRKLFAKVFDRVTFHFQFILLFHNKLASTYGIMVAQGLPTVKG